MKIYKNTDFDILMKKYHLDLMNLPDLQLPPYLKSVLTDQVIQNKYGIGLSNSYLPCKDPEGYGQSYYDDFMNHFHITDIHSNDKNAFISAVFIVYKLASKFEELKLTDIRIWLSFQGKEMSRNWSKKHKFCDKDNEYYISDRISFYKKIAGEVVISEEFGEDIEDTAVLIIDI